MQEIKLRKAAISDIDTISALAKTIWNQHYISIISQDQINYMLLLMYSHDSLIDQMQNKKHSFYLIEKEDRCIGFISVYPGEEGNWFLSKFYIDQQATNKGYGQQVFQDILGLTKAKTITLAVNRENYKSVNFYFKLGFKIKEIIDLEIGNNYLMNDFVMIWTRK